MIDRYVVCVFRRLVALTRLLLPDFDHSFVKLRCRHYTAMRMSQQGTGVMSRTALGSPHECAQSSEPWRVWYVVEAWWLYFAVCNMKRSGDSCLLWLDKVRATVGATGATLGNNRIVRE